ncbi:Rv3654c family TadE-like protein [Corynebacterium sp. A21]|uniref:Rv3654c family TadE-like protein n=1 Tax=Corynebacterium sp. A21 TaxID=3457318 RepID=UPI003FD34720
MLWRDESGYATVAATAIIVVLISLGMVVAAGSGQVIAGHRAQLAADLAAVSGAEAQAQGQEGCAVAASTAALNSGALISCTTRGGDVITEVAVQRRTATARAGRI